MNQAPEEFTVRDRRGEEKAEVAPPPLEEKPAREPDEVVPPPRDTVREVTWRIPKRLHQALVHWAARAATSMGVTPGVSVNDLAISLLVQGVQAIEQHVLAQQQAAQQKIQQAMTLSADPDVAAAQIKEFMAKKEAGQ